MRQPICLERLVIHEQGPAQESYVPLSSGLTVLYGLNGAGKMTVLLATQAGLSGQGGQHGAADIGVLLNCVGENDDQPNPLEEAYAIQWADQEELVWTPAGVSQELGVPTAGLMQRAALDSVDGWTTLLGHVPSDDKFVDAHALAHQVSTQRRFLVRPAFGEGTWEVEQAAAPSEDADLVDALISRIRAASVASGEQDIDGFASIADPFDWENPYVDLPKYVVVLSDGGKHLRLDRTAWALDACSRLLGRSGQRPGRPGGREPKRARRVSRR